MYDLIIIGGGAGGITAGIYASRQKLNTLMITKGYGGQMANKATEVCNYPGFPRVGGQELIEKFVDHLKVQEHIEIRFGEVVKMEKKNGVFSLTTKEKEILSSKAVIVATGADPRALEVPGEKEFIGKGVSYCVTCDGPIFRNKDVVVAGGGNAGLEAAIFLTNYANKVFLLEYSDKLKADAQNQAEVKKLKKVEIITNAEIKEIKGGNFVNALTYEDLKTKKVKEIEIQGVFIEIGSMPATSLVKDLVDFNERDEIKVDFETFQTKTSGLFAAGDVNVGKYKQIVSAAGEGCKAALAAYEYIKTQKK